MFGISKGLGWFGVLLGLTSGLPVSGQAQRGYVYPGAVQLLTSSGANDFPDSPDARRWLVGLSEQIARTLHANGADPCHYQPSATVRAARAAAMVKGVDGGYIQYSIVYAGSADGTNDARTFAGLHTGCADLVATFERAVVLESSGVGREPDPDEEDFRALRNGPWRGGVRPSMDHNAWWGSLTGDWEAPDMAVVGRSPSSVQLTLSADSTHGRMADLSRGAHTTSPTFHGGWILTTVTGTGGQAIPFYNCATRVREGERAQECAADAKDHYMDATLQSDGSLRATIHLWIDWQHRWQTYDFTFVRPAPKKRTAPPLYAGATAASSASLLDGGRLPSACDLISGAEVSRSLGVEVLPAQPQPVDVFDSRSRTVSLPNEVTASSCLFELAPTATTAYYHAVMITARYARLTDAEAALTSVEHQIPGTYDVRDFKFGRGFEYPVLQSGLKFTSFKSIPGGMMVLQVAMRGPWGTGDRNAAYDDMFRHSLGLTARILGAR